MKTYLIGFIMFNVLAFFIYSVENHQSMKQGSIENPKQSNLNDSFTSSEKDNDDDDMEQPFDYKDAKDFVMKHLTKDGVFICAMVNSGHYQFLANFQIAMKKIGMETAFTVIALDSNLEKKAQELKINVIAATKFITFPQYTDQSQLVEVQWGGADYNRFVNGKIDIVHSILSNIKVPVLFTDIDLVWNNANIVEYLVTTQKLGNYDFVMARDMMGVYWNACTGFYYVQPTNFAIDVLQEITVSQSDEQLNDQHLFNFILSDRIKQPANKLRFHMLPLQLFMNGEMFNSGQMEKWKNPWLLHANYVVGAESKKSLLKQARYWYIEDSLEEEK